MKEIDTLNIPAFKRKRSISARARKTPSYNKVIKKTTTRKRVTRPKFAYEEDISDIPVRQQMLEQDDVFPDPLDVNPFTTSKNSNETREMKICGTCDGYFDKIEVAVFQLTSPLRQGDTILFETTNGLFEQPVDSMQINRKDVRLARSGSDIGLKVLEIPKVGGTVYKVI